MCIHILLTAMTELLLDNTNIHLMTISSSQINTIKYLKNLGHSGEIFIESIKKYRNNFPKLTNLEIEIIGTTVYHIDLKKYEELYYLFDDPLLTYINISNGINSVTKTGDSIIMKIPYCEHIPLLPNVTEIIYQNTGLYTNNICYKSLPINFPVSLKKINFVHVNGITKNIRFTVFDKYQKIPFGTELYLTIISPQAIIENISYEMSCPKLNVIYNAKINDKIIFSPNITLFFNKNPIILHY